MRRRRRFARPRTIRDPLKRLIACYSLSQRPSCPSDIVCNLRAVSKTIHISSLTLVFAFVNHHVPAMHALFFSLLVSFATTIAKPLPDLPSFAEDASFSDTGITDSILGEPYSPTNLAFNTEQNVQPPSYNTIDGPDVNADAAPDQFNDLALSLSYPSARCSSVKDSYCCPRIPAEYVSDEIFQHLCHKCAFQY